MINRTSVRLVQIIFFLNFLGWFGAAQAERQIANYQEFTAILNDDQSCSVNMTVVARHPSPDAFTEQRAQLQRLLGGVKSVITNECSKVNKLLIIGESAHKPVYRGELSSATEWVLKNTSGAVEERPVSNTASRTQDKCGNILHVIETSCRRTLSKYEQGFMAGASRTLLNLCGYPTNMASRLKLQRFLTSSAWVVAAGSNYSDDDLRISIGSQTQSTVSYATGVQYAKSIECTQGGKRLANNIVKYIDETSSGSKDKPNWVAGCANYYSGRYSKAQCQCIADFGRAVIPSIHQTRFSRFTLKKIIKGNPFVGLQIAMQCGVGDY